MKRRTVLIYPEDAWLEVPREVTAALLMMPTKVRGLENIPPHTHQNLDDGCATEPPTLQFKNYCLINRPFPNELPNHFPLARR